MSDLTEKYTSFLHRHKQESSDSDSLSSSDNESVSSLFSHFEPQMASSLFQATSVNSQTLITKRSSHKRRRSSLTLLSERKKRKRIGGVKKTWLQTSQVLNSPRLKNPTQVGCLVELVPFFHRQFQKILPRKFKNVAEFFACWLRFQTFFLSFCTPLQRDEFNSSCFQLGKMQTKKAKPYDGNTVVSFGSENRIPVYVLRDSLGVGKWCPFQDVSTAFLHNFFTLTSAQSYVLWQSVQKFSPPLQAFFWQILDKFAPATFYVQPHLQDAFVATFSLDVKSSPQYLATLKRFAKFVNKTRHFPTSNLDAQFAYAHNVLKTCSQYSYTLIQGWLLRLLARGLAFTTLRTYCLHLSWFQQPNERRYSKSQEFKRFLIQSVARFFSDSQDHGSDPMDQKTLHAFWQVFETSTFSEAQYDKNGFTWILQLALRVVEAISNQWCHVDFNEHNVGVVQKITNAKNQKLFGKTYVLALKATNDEFCPVQCLRFLAKHGKSKFVFYNRLKKRGWTNRSINQRFQYYVKQLPPELTKNKKFTVYSLRATFACSLAQANVDINIIQTLMRHKCSSSTMTYTQKAFPHISFANLLDIAHNSSAKTFDNVFHSNLKSTLC